MSGPPTGRRRARVPRLRAPRLDRQQRRYFLKRTVITFFTSRGVDSAAATSYFAALSVLPIALVTVSAVALHEGHDRAVDRILQILDDVLQGNVPDVLPALLDQLVSAPNPGVGLAFGIALTVWSIGSYLTAFGRGVNAFYGVQEGRLIWKFRLLMTVLTVPVVAGGAVAAVVIASTPRVARAIGDALGFGEPWLTAWQWVRLPLLLLVLLGVLTLVTTFTTNVRRESLTWFSWGALTALLGGGLVAGALTLWFSVIVDTNRFYGVLGSGIVVLITLFAFNLVLLLGACVDAELLRVRQLRGGLPVEETVRVPVRDTTRLHRLASGRTTLLRDGREIREQAERDRATASGHRAAPEGLPAAQPTPTERG